MVIQYPMSFELRNPRTQKLTHCGVMEFSSEEGHVLLPDWMMEKMGFEAGELAMIKNVNLVKGTYVKLQPHTTDFLRISDPKSVLETTLRSYSCLTAGDTIMIMYDDKKYYVDILETKPSSSAISIIETDCEVDFATPLDYKEPEKPAAKEIEKEVAAAEEETKFRAFTGVGRRLDGTSVFSPIPTLNENSSSTSTCLGKRKLVFGSSESADQHKSSKALKKLEEEPNKGKIKVFQAFTGISYRLTD
ncbi:hypothetical protein FNV43_RR14916 [Rhamnella rubrinervis]|uniref:Ubiquitin fusion degradaton protein n=1 Tax=Rhamnella rubrinervis TaxID=2594499 RepID=A0A8K0MGS3_9ROSA|nr:hypothetical protein FNV43_RR14916 [Rhamnella rubrinervis]